MTFDEKTNSAFVDNEKVTIPIVGFLFIVVKAFFLVCRPFQFCPKKSDEYVME